MIADLQLMTAVEQLGYRVTCGDVATHAGIHLEKARSGLLALAEQTGGDLQVTTTGELIYAFPQSFRQILLRKNLELRVRSWLNKIWSVLFYLIKISFGTLLITSIAVVYLTILGITVSSMLSFDCGDCGDCGDGGGSGGSGGNCVLNIFDWGGSNSSSSPTPIMLSSSEDRHRKLPIRAKTDRKPLNFLEAVFSVLFGDGDPNADIERRRWTYIGNLIHRQQGVAIAEQIAPFLDSSSAAFRENRDNENYMLPVLTKFNGIPEVSPQGQLVYHFPDLQTTLKDESDRSMRVPQCLKERKWKFTNATPSQHKWAIALFGANLIGITVLALMLAKSGSWAMGIISILALYGIGLVVIPSCRYIWVQYQNDRVKQRNRYRHQQVSLLLQEDSIPAKLEFALQFAKQHKITERDILYTTEENILEQEFKKLEGSE